MAVVKASFKDLAELCGDGMSEKELAEILDSIGAPLDEKDGDVLYIEVTPDRPDYLAVEGIAHSIRHFKGMQCSVEKNIIKSNYKIKAGSINSRPYIASLIARNVGLDANAIDSLMQLQEKMHETFGRKRKKIAIGMHNLDAIEGNEIAYYAGKGSEKFVPLFENREMSLREMLKNTEKGRLYGNLIGNEFPIVADAKGVIAAPPILNSERTKVAENTTNIFVDITGTNRKNVADAACIIALALAMRGGKIEQVFVQYKSEGAWMPNMERREIEFSAEYVNRLLGVEFGDGEIEKFLKKMDINAIKTNGKIAASYPCWRVDIMSESDIAEEVAIAYGYNEFKPQKPELFTIGGECGRKRRVVREFMVGFGFREICTFVLSNEEDESGLFGLKNVKYAKLENPLTIEHTIARKSLVPSMLKVMNTNKKHKLPLQLFEVGECINEKGETVWKMCAAVYGKDAGFERISGFYSTLIERFGIEYDAKKIDVEYMIDGRAAAAKMKNGVKAVMGEVHPRVLRKLGLEYPVALVEVELEGF